MKKHIALILLCFLFAGCKPTEPAAPPPPLDVHAELLPLARKARLGDAEAQYKFGMEYLIGEKVTRDWVNAYVWFTLAAQQSHSPAITFRQQVALRLTTLDLFEEAHGKAQLYYDFYKSGTIDAPIPHDYTLIINGEAFHIAAAISPEGPVNFKAIHNDPTIKNGLMQDPTIPTHRRNFRMSQMEHAANHTSYMARDILSASDYHALDPQGTIIDTIRIVYVPSNLD